MADFSILAWIRATDAAELPAVTYRLVVALVPLMDAGGLASMRSLEGLAERTGIPGRTLKRYLADLQATGLVERRRGHGVQAILPANGPKVAHSEGARSGPLRLNGPEMAPCERATSGPLDANGPEVAHSQGARNGPLRSNGPEVAHSERARSGPLDANGPEVAHSEWAKNGPSPHTPLIGTLPSAAVAAAAAAASPDPAPDPDPVLQLAPPLPEGEPTPAQREEAAVIQAAGVSPRWLEGGASRLPRFRRDVRKAVAAHGLELVELAVEDLLAWAERERIESPPAALNRCIEKRVEDRANPIPLPPVRRQRRPDPLPAPVAGAFGSSGASAISSYGNRPPHRLPAVGHSYGSQSFDPARGALVYWFFAIGAPLESGCWLTHDEFVTAESTRRQVWEQAQTHNPS